jgi:hypothetical protein
VTTIVAKRVTPAGARGAAAGDLGHRPDATDQIATGGSKEKVKRC